ncbi:MAG: hypothetical protein O7B99_08065, partial [Planctomycetota bacterium]|nr:hypothetical protein [Planctomycetota bacterium]
HLTNRSSSILPRPEVVTDDEELEDLGLPLSLREFVVLPSFEPDHFRDFRDEDGTIVHSIGSFLTVLTGLQARVEYEQEGDEGAGPGAPGAPGAPGDRPEEDLDEQELGDGATGSIGGAEGPTGASSGGSGGGGESEATGIAVNINTAPAAVLKALMDDRDVPLRFWDDVIEYRNEEDEEAMAEYEDDPPVDEFGDPILIPRVFESLDQLDEFDDYRDLDALLQGELRQLLDVKSNVFSIFVTARKPTGLAAGGQNFSKEELLEEEEAGQALVRTVRCTVWRRQGTSGVELIPLERWEVLDYLPLEVQDYPDEDR